MSNGKTAKDNMRLWRAFERTDPKHTKPVEFGRKFTSIDAHWQIMRVTEILGPVGEGWSYDVAHSIHTIHDKLVVAMADVMISWGDKNIAGTMLCHYGPIRGCSELYYEGRGGKLQFDDDAPKKATTDALTKALSHLGVSADVFLGLFDDNKYVTRIKREFAAEDAVKAGLPMAVQMALDQLPKVNDMAELETTVNNAREAAATWDPIHKDVYALRVRERRLQLGAPGG